MEQLTTSSGTLIRYTWIGFFVFIVAMTLPRREASAQWKQASGFSNANAFNAQNLDYVNGFLPWGTYLGASAGCGVSQDGATIDSLFLSTDNGVTWNGIAPNGGEPALAVPTGGSVPELIGTQIWNPTTMDQTHKVLSYSTDGGQTWTADTTGWNTPNGTGLAMYLANIGTTVFAATASGIYQQTTPGGTWTVDTVGVGLIFKFGFAFIGGLYAMGSDLYLSTYTNGIYISTNMGASWTTVNNGLPTIFYPNGGFATIGSSLFVITAHDSNEDSYDFYRTTNNGQNWTRMNSTPQAWGSVNPMFTAAGNTLFAASDSGLFVSNDNGATWIQQDQGLPAFENSFNYVAAVAGPNLILNTPQNGVWYRQLSDFSGSGVSEISTMQQGLSLSLVPNPADQTESISYHLENSGMVRITLTDEAGREIRVLQNSSAQAGTHILSADLQPLEAGTYFVRLEANGASTTQKLVIAH